MTRHWSPIRVPVSLRCLFPHSSFVGCADIRVSTATERSDQCSSNSLFAAIPGTKNDGTRYVGEAIERGATALLVEQPLFDAAVPQCIVKNIRKAYATLCAELEGRPSNHLKIAGVTGTNGKTTVAWMIRSILEQAGSQTGLLGTIEYSDGVESTTATLTTPDSKMLSNRLAAMVSRKSTHAAIELSSHALDQDRSAGTDLDVAVVTNVTQDHFDYHSDYNSYLTSKKRIIKHLKPGGRIVLNADDPGCRSFQDDLSESDYQQTTFGLENEADVSARILEESLDGSRFLVTLSGTSQEIQTPLVGRHNISNCLAAAIAASHLGMTPEQIACGLATLKSIPGRMERIDASGRFRIFVDYAHTDDALQRSIASLKEFTTGRVICVFGAGGDRDRSKRALLGHAAAKADLAVVTSDNPRTESPEAIIEDILTGFQETSKRPYVEADRAQAIRWAIQHAGPDDCILVAGKGHETEQIIGTTRIPFDDREVIRNILSEIFPTTGSQRERIRA